VALPSGHGRGVEDRPGGFGMIGEQFLEHRFSAN
jgi:hypothetical protein